MRDTISARMAGRLAPAVRKAISFLSKSCFPTGALRFGLPAPKLCNVRLTRKTARAHRPLHAPPGKGRGPASAIVWPRDSLEPSLPLPRRFDPWSETQRHRFSLRPWPGPNARKVNARAPVKGACALGSRMALSKAIELPRMGQASLSDSFCGSVAACIEQQRGRRDPFGGRRCARRDW